MMRRFQGFQLIKCVMDSVDPFEAILDGWRLVAAGAAGSARTPECARRTARSTGTAEAVRRTSKPARTALAIRTKARAPESTAATAHVHKH